MKTRDVKVTATLGPAGIEWDIDGAKPNASCIDFKRKLDDTTGKGVRFTTLDAEDYSNSCPPAVTSNKSKLIVGEHVDPHDPTKARFTDNNNNDAKAGVVNVSFQWHFDCDDPSIKHIDTYDPVVPNGGKT